MTRSDLLLCKLSKEVSVVYLLLLLFYVGVSCSVEASILFENEIYLAEK